MYRVSLAVCLFLFCGLSVMAQPKVDIATPQPPDVIGIGTDAQQVLKVVGGKGGKSLNGMQPGNGSSVLIQAGDGGDGAMSAGGDGAGGSIILLPGAAGTGGDVAGIPGAVGVGTSTPQKMLSVNAGMNIDQADLNSSFFLNAILTFGSNSGEGIGSPRTVSSSNRFGLDFYTAGTRRMFITNGGVVTILGSLIKPAGSFKIDHPLDPKNKYLYHSFVESPDMKN